MLWSEQFVLYDTHMTVISPTVIGKVLMFTDSDRYFRH